MSQPPAYELHDPAAALGGVSLKAPYDAFWGSRYATVEGPGPLVVGLMSIADPQWPVKSGRRLSRKAVRPSSASALAHAALRATSNARSSSGSTWACSRPIL